MSVTVCMLGKMFGHRHRESDTRFWVTVNVGPELEGMSAVLCGLAGALYVPQVGIINPSEMSPTGWSTR